MRLPPPPRTADARDPAAAPAAPPPVPLRAWLLRHGEVAAPFAGTAYGDRDVPLSERGRGQTRALALAFSSERAPAREFGPVDRVLASPLERARVLGEAVARAARAPLEVDARLRELDRGAWQDLPLAEYEERWRAQAPQYWRDPLGWSGNGGESEAALRARVWPAFEARARAGGDLVVAAHRNVVRAIVAVALGLPAGASHALRLDPGRGVLLLGSGEQGWRLARTNGDPADGDR